MRLALRARVPGITAHDVDWALTQERSLVIGWLMRGTLHLVRSDDYLWLHQLTAPTQVTTNRRRLGQEGVSPEMAARAVEIIEQALEAEGPLTRADLAGRLAAEHIRTEGQAMPHLLLHAALRGTIVLGPVTPRGPAFVLVREWLGTEPADPPTDAARSRTIVEFARRYLISHGPATAADLANWSGLNLRDARAALRSIQDDLIAVGNDLAALASAYDPGAGAAAVPPRLLPAFDPYLLGWRDRTFAVHPEHARLVHPGGGMLRAVATVDGIVVGTWAKRRQGSHVQISIQPVADLAPEATAALDAEAADVTRFENPQ